MNPDGYPLTVQTGDIQTKAWRYGAEVGPTLVLVHGFRGDHHGLEGIAASLARSAPELRVIVPDLPGFGGSPAAEDRAHSLDFFGRWLNEFVSADEIAGQGFAILGHSFGSLVVANALSQGLSPSKVVLINPIASPALKGPQALMTALAILYYKAAAALPERPSRLLLGNPFIVRVMSEFMAKTPDRELRSWIHDQHDRYFSDFSDSESLLAAFRASVSHTVTEYAGSFREPTLMIVGDRDDLTPLKAQLALQRRIESCTMKIAPGVGHLVHYEAVELAVAEILAFLRLGEQR